MCHNLKHYSSQFIDFSPLQPRCFLRSSGKIHYNDAWRLEASSHRFRSEATPTVHLKETLVSIFSQNVKGECTLYFNSDRRLVIKSGLSRTHAQCVVAVGSGLKVESHYQH